MQGSGEKKVAAWKPVWRLTDDKGELGVGVKKGKAQKHGHDLQTGRYKLVIWSDDLRAGKGPCAVTATIELFNASGDKVGSDEVSLKKPNRKEKLAFVVAEEGENIPARASIVISCGALVKKVKVYATLGYREGLTDPSSFEPENVMFDTSRLKEAQRIQVEAILAEWPPLEGATAATYDNSLAIKELSRDSEEKQRAFECGMIRPFLLLASMHPKRRAIWAKTLDIDLLAKSWYGDAHKEAWLIIDKDRQGIQGRSNFAFRESLNPFARSCNWYEILERVTKKAFHKEKLVDEATHKEIKAAKKSYKQTIGPCLDPSDVTVSNMEQLFMRAFTAVMLASFPEQQKEVVNELIEKDDKAKELVERMRAAHWNDGYLIRYIVAQSLLGDGKENATQAALHFTSKIETGTGNAVKIAIPSVMLFISPIPAIPAFMLVRNSLAAAWGSTPGRLIPAIIGTLGQRSWLSIGGIRIEDYYPSLTA